jgi:hypothetical protein|tara:strand:- start:571 stop:702 length:132 start_codon:yes stop_codon:yes gene_type:complete
LDKLFESGGESSFSYECDNKKIPQKKKRRRKREKRETLILPQK